MTQSPLHLPHVLFDTTTLHKILPQLSILNPWNLVKTLQVFTQVFSFPCGDRATSDAQEKLPTGGGVCKDLSCQEACVGDGGELERALVDVTGTGKTVPSCRGKRFEKKFCKGRLNSPTVVKVFETKFGQVVEKSFEFVLCLLGLVKATKF